MNKTYEVFENDLLNIAEKIQQRRYQLLIHSCIYYELNQNIISDKKWDEWARELRDLQKTYPEVSEKVTLYEAFKDWDASTGAFLPIKEPWVIQKASWILTHQGKVSTQEETTDPSIVIEQRNKAKLKPKKLFDI